MDSVQFNNEQFIDLNGNTAVHSAIINENFDFTKLIEEENVNLESANNKGNTPLHLAVMCGNLDVFKSLVDKNVNLECINNEGNRPIHLAIMFDNFEILRILIDRNVDLECENNEGNTPLHIAIIHINLKAIKILIEKNVNLDCMNDNGVTPIILAVYQRKWDLIKYIVNLTSLTRFGCSTLVHKAILHEKLDILKLLIAKNVDLMQTDVNGDMPIHLAAQEGKLEYMKVIVEKIENLDCKNKDGNTAVHLAAQKGLLETMSVLHLKNAILECRNNRGNTPLHLAAANNKLEMVRHLIDANVDPKCTNFDGYNAFDSLLLSDSEHFLKQFVNYTQPEILTSNIDRYIQNNFDKRLMCRLAKEPHILSDCSLNFNCGHKACIGCLIEHIGNNLDNILFCCLNNVRVYDKTSLFLILQKNVYKKFDHFHYGKPLLDVLKFSIEHINNMTEKGQNFENMIRFIEEDTDIRYESLRMELTRIRKTFLSIVEKRRTNWKSILRNVNCENFHDNVNKYEKFYFNRAAFNYLGLNEFGDIKVTRRNIRGFVNESLLKHVKAFYKSQWGKKEILMEKFNPIWTYIENQKPNQEQSNNFVMSQLKILATKCKNESDRLNVIEKVYKLTKNDVLKENIKNLYDTEI